MARLDVRVKLSLLVAACLLGLVILLKNVVGVSPEVRYRNAVQPPFGMSHYFQWGCQPVRERGVGVQFVQHIVRILDWGLISPNI